MNNQHYTERTMQEDLDRLRGALLDFAYVLLKSLGVVALAKRVPWLRLRPWVREREAERD